MLVNYYINLYNFISSLAEIEQITKFPIYDTFRTSLSRKKNKDEFLLEIKEILEVENTRSYYTLGDLLNFMGLPTDDICPFDLCDNKFPTDKITIKQLDSFLHTSPMKYIESKMCFHYKKKDETISNL